MLPLTTVVVFVTSDRSPGVVAAIRGTVIDCRYANPGKEGGKGSESKCFFHKVSIELCLEEHLVVECVNYIGVCVVYCIKRLRCVRGRCTPNLNKDLLKEKKMRRTYCIINK